MLFWEITQHTVVIPYRRFGITYRVPSSRAKMGPFFYIIGSGSFHATGRQHRGCIIPQAVTHSLVLLKMGKIIARNMLSWLELLICRYFWISLVVYIIYNKHQIVTYCVDTVLRYSWWWTVDFSETCRVLYQINLRNSASRWFSL